ncbi:MAG: TIGR03790 family protein [Verrucomicrobia bacterium]|nr:TIGR03790 family protein [Verrucomicrobiota bacterium]
MQIRLIGPILGPLFAATLLLDEAFVSSSASAAGQGDSVIVVYNANAAESKRLAEYYAARREVPANQLLGLDLPTSEAMTRREYQKKLQQPILERFERLMGLGAEAGTARKRLQSGGPSASTGASVRYAVLCYGVPLRIGEDSTLKEDDLERIPAQLRKNEAAVDSELALLPRNGTRPRWYGPSPNPCYGTTNQAYLNPTNGVLMVARLDGPSVEVARGLIDKAIQAEQEGLWGRAYYDARGLTNGNTKIGDDWIKGAAEVSRRVGFETILDNKEERFAAGFPMSQIALYAGWYEPNGQISGPFARPHVEFMPGALAYHLHSFSAQTVRSTSQGWVGPLLEKGATATFGFVHEPYLEFTPNIAILFHRFLALGFSFGEAAYASQTFLSWQTTVVGDPLYRPFGKSPRRQHEELLLNESGALEWWHLKVVNMNLAADQPAGDLIEYLEHTPQLPLSAVLLEKLGDLYFSRAKFLEAITAYRKAASRASSPQQKVRLALELGRTLELSGAAGEAYAVYQGFVKDFSEYPDLVNVYRKLVNLADHLKRPEEKEQYQREIERLSSVPSA